MHIEDAFTNHRCDISATKEMPKTRNNSLLVLIPALVTDVQVFLVGPHGLHVFDGLGEAGLRQLAFGIDLRQTLLGPELAPERGW